MLGCRLSQAPRYALAHFSGRLAGKRNGQHGVGFLLASQQPQVALDQQFGLARTCGGLDDERALRVERPFANPLVGRSRHDCSSSWIRLSTWYCPRALSS